MTPTREIIIAGGGLAGLSLGIALRTRGVTVTIHEAGNYPRHRVCGEFISGISLDELRALQIDELFHTAQRHHSTAWYDSTSLVLHRSLPEAALGLSRNCLDSALAEKFTRLGGTLHTSSRLSDDAEGIVWACGRRKDDSPWIGLKAHFSSLPLDADLEVHLGHNSYVGLTGVEDGRVNVCGIFKQTAALREPGGNALLTAIESAGLHALAARLRSAQFHPESMKGVTHFSLGWQQSRPGEVCIGDASAMIPPFTGNGMTMAFQSALAALKPLQSWTSGETDWTSTAQNIAALQKHLFHRRLFWARLLQSILLHPLGRKTALWLVARGLIPFETLYRQLR